MSPCDFISRITQHIPDKSFQLVRYYGWYSNKMRGQRRKQTDAETVDAPGGEIIDVSAFKPRRIPSKKWRELIKKVWEADPLLCTHCQNEMRIMALIDDASVIKNTSCATSGCGRPASGWSPPVTHRNPPSRSSNHGSTIPSPTTTTNR